MVISRLIRWVGNNSLAVSDYHPLAVKILNRTSFDIHIQKSSSATIGEDVRIIGELKLESDVSIGDNSTLIGDIHIDRGTTITRGVDIIGDVSIGRYSTIARHTTFQAQNHTISTPAVQNRLYTELLNKPPQRDKSEVIVGNDVWFGTKVIVLPGVEIGDGAVIGAGSVVTKDVEPYSVYAGTPAEKLRNRFSEPVKDLLMEIEWWNWPKEKIRRNEEFFQKDLVQCNNKEDFLKSYIDK